MTNESSANAIIGNTLRIIASGEYHPGAELTQKMASYIIELEQKLTDMAEQLANDESKCRELAAENGGLKKAAEFATADDMWIEQADGMLDYRYCEWYVDVLKAAMETPATDAILAEVRAQESKRVYESILDNPAVTDMGSLVDLLEQHAEDSASFAAQLRQGAAL